MSRPLPHPLATSLDDALSRDIERLRERMRETARRADPNPFRERRGRQAGLTVFVGAIGAGGLLPLINSANLATAEGLAGLGLAGVVGVGVSALARTLRDRWARPIAKQQLQEMGQAERTHLAVRDVLLESIQQAQQIENEGGSPETGVGAYRRRVGRALGLATEPQALPHFSLDQTRTWLADPALQPSARDALISMSVSLHGKRATEAVLPDTLKRDSETLRVLDRVYAQVDTAAWSVITATLDATRQSGTSMESYLQAIEPFLRLSDQGALPQGSLMRMILESDERYGPPAIQAIQASLMQGTDASREQFATVAPFVQSLLHPDQQALDFEAERPDTFDERPDSEASPSSVWAPGR